MSEILTSARKTLDTEITGLQEMSGKLDHNFVEAVEAIQKMKDAKAGRLIIAGIGKSGHVGRKLAATLASTGTPSYYVHPGEASHGDMGMVTENDVVLMMSWSGETQELSDLIHYTKRFEITSIGMTAGAESTLAKHCDIPLILPKAQEACPNGLAPTTSTTMMMALGDAIAVCLLEKMGLSADDFKVWHPGGKLGQKLLKVSDLMHPLDKLPLVSKDTTMDQAILKLSEYNLGCVIVGQGADMAGIITDGDLKRHMGPDLLARKVTDIMSKTPKTIASDVLAAEALHVMTKTPGQYLTSLVVVKDGALAGLIRLQDCLQAGVA